MFSQAIENPIGMNLAKIRHFGYFL
ncbi:hypothetical protein XACS582_13180002 [Xanthomonas citri pv. citri]|nr:hypothetical protein XACS582_13180002 [Xanthomonas citri pv. citri]